VGLLIYYRHWANEKGRMWKYMEDNYQSKPKISISTAYLQQKKLLHMAENAL
jgi:hypothetical protein